MTRSAPVILFFVTSLALCSAMAAPADRAHRRPRVIIETDAGGDPDDEQSLVRLLLYANDLEIEGIIANRSVARERENLNPVRTGLGIVRRQLDAYGACYPHLKQHDPRYPTREHLWRRAVPGYADTEAGVELILAAVDRNDPRPIWFCNWGTDQGSAESSLKRALDRVLRERGPSGYARFKSRLRLSSSDQFGAHTTTLSPPWRLWVDTFRPEIDRQRWYHRFSALTATAGGFDLQRDVLTGHGPLGALYPTNTNRPQKEGDTMSFLYLVPTGMNDPDHPEWGSWGGRYGASEEAPGKPYYWANQKDTWQGATMRDNTLKRWAVPLQNDFRARLDWCVKDYQQANHPPEARVRGSLVPRVVSGETVRLDAGNSRDPDGQALQYEWKDYPEPGSYRGDPIRIRDAGSSRASFVAPEVEAEVTLHVILAVTDTGSPPLTRYRRIIAHVSPRERRSFRQE